jgi:hypothetical protein
LGPPGGRPSGALGPAPLQNQEEHKPSIFKEKRTGFLKSTDQCSNHCQLLMMSDEKQRGKESEREREKCERKRERCAYILHIYIQKEQLEHVEIYV